jgi:hypothetical protein
MQRLHTRHTSRMNQKLNHQGHLFRGRFRSIIFDDSQLKEVIRSVHLWPLREGLVKRASSYLYSSHQIYLGSENLDFIDTDAVFSNFMGDKEGKCRAYIKFIEMAALDKDNYGVTELIPGIGDSEELIKKARLDPLILRRSSILTLALRASLILNISMEQLKGPSRRQDLVMARRLFATAAVLGAQRSVTEVANFLARDKAQISRLVGQGMDLMQHHEPFLLLYETLKPKGALI